VLDEQTGQVLGVLRHREAQGEKGLAISIEALQALWPAAPLPLLAPTSAPSTSLPAAPSPALLTAQKVLAMLETRAAGYTVLSLPVTLQLELEEKRKEVELLQSLESSQNR
jgi:hypothetical protein